MRQARMKRSASLALCAAAALAVAPVEAETVEAAADGQIRLAQAEPGSAFDDDAVFEREGIADFEGLEPGGDAGATDGVNSPDYDELIEDIEGSVTRDYDEIGGGTAGGGIVGLPDPGDASGLPRTPIGEIGAGAGDVRTPEIGEVDGPAPFGEVGADRDGLGDIGGNIGLSDR